MSSQNAPKPPRAVIESAEDARAREEQGAAEGAVENAAAVPSGSPQAAPGTAPAGRFQDATIGFIEGMGRRAWTYADAHPHTVLYGAVGFIAAVLILVLGLWHTIVIAVFTGVGAAVGKMRDGAGGMDRLVNRLFNGK